MFCRKASHKRGLFIYEPLKNDCLVSAGFGSQINQLRSQTSFVNRLSAGASLYQQNKIRCALHFYYC
jgi:hypothetical protein